MLIPLGCFKKCPNLVPKTHYNNFLKEMYTEPACKLIGMVIRVKECNYKSIKEVKDAN